MNQDSHHPLISELNEAILNGYYYDFILRSDGLLQCRSNPSRHYEIHELNIVVFTCFCTKASLYLITTIDGVKGHMIDYWENSSTDY